MFFPFVIYFFRCNLFALYLVLILAYTTYRVAFILFDFVTVYHSDGYPKSWLGTMNLYYLLLLLPTVLDAQTFKTYIGDPGMTNMYPSTSLTLWTFCNQAIGPNNYFTGPSPRYADCASIDGPGPNGNKITLMDENLIPGDAFPNPIFNTTWDINQYARTKELYLASQCASLSPDQSFNSSGWAIMFKSGNMNIAMNLCPKTNSTVTNTYAAAVAPSLSVINGASENDHNSQSNVKLSRPWNRRDSNSLRFNNLPMNQPLVVHGWTADNQPVPYNSTGFMGYFAGTYDVNPNATMPDTFLVQQALHSYTQAWMQYRIDEIYAVDNNLPIPSNPTVPSLLTNLSYLFAIWYQNTTSNTTVYYMGQSTSANYPWLMNYIRSNQLGVQGYGGYPWQGTGIMKGPLPSVFSKLIIKFTALAGENVAYSGVHFYMPCYGGCWKLDGTVCDGDLNNDATRYVCFQINAPAGDDGCSPTNQNSCPLIHYSLNGTAIYSNNTAEFPYSCYAGACPPWGCDPYSNPIPQELLFLKACSEWAPHGFPSTPQEGWFNSSQLWNMDVGTLGARLHLTGKDPVPSAEIQQRIRENNLPPYPGYGRTWLDFEIGPEEFASSNGNLIRWEVTNWDVQVST